MTYKIIEKIGKFKIGDEVSDEIGMILAKMYIKSPVEKVEREVKTPVVKEAGESKKEESEIKEVKSSKKKGFFNK